MDDISVSGNRKDPILDPLSVLISLDEIHPGFDNCLFPRPKIAQNTKS